MIRRPFFFVLCAALIAFTALAYGSGPTVTVSGVAVSPNPACGPTATVTVTATVTQSYDTGSDTTTPGRCVTQRSGSVTTGYTRTDTQTVITYSNPAHSETVSDGTNTVNLGDSLTIGAEGKTVVTVTGNASEDQTTQINTIDSTWAASAGGCTGTAISSSTTTGTPSTVTLTGTNSANTSYRTDELGPTINLTPPQGHTVPQGAPYVQGFNAIGGSAGASYNASFAAAGDTLHATVGPATTSGNFPTSDVPNGSGIATNEHVGPEALSTSCTTPIDSYTMTATLNSNNLCSGSGPVVNDYLATGTDHFNVTAGLNLNSQTVVVAEFPSQSGPEYGVDQCFNSTGTKKISNDPGSVHVAEIVTSAGTCTDVDTLKGVTLTLTIPAGFSFTTGGHSPPAHVFVFDAAGSGFDLHYPPNEVTTAVHQTVSGNTVTLDLSSVDLSSVDVGLRLGAGNIPSTYTIYARAKTSYTGTSAPAGDTAFKFSTTASSGSDNAGQLFASSDSGPYYIVANPTQDPVNHSTASCVGGVITPK